MLVSSVSRRLALRLIHPRARGLLPGSGSATREAVDGHRNRPNGGHKWR